MRLNFVVNLLFDLILTELDPAQLVAAQPFHARPERRHRQILVVDDQSGRQTGQIRPPEGHLHGDVKVREEARPRQEEGLALISFIFSGPLVARRVFHEYLISRRMDRGRNERTLDDWKRLNGKTFDAKFSLEY